MDDEVRSSMPWPRKRGPRDPRSWGKKQMRKCSQGQNLQETQLQNSRLEKEAIHLEGKVDQQLQVKRTQHGDSILEHLLKQHWEEEDEAKEVSTILMPRKRGPRGSGRSGRKSQGKDLQVKELQEQDSQLGKKCHQVEDVADQGQGFQVGEHKNEDSVRGSSIKLESIVGQAPLPRRKRLFLELFKSFIFSAQVDQ